MQSRIIRVGDQRYIVGIRVYLAWPEKSTNKRNKEKLLAFIDGYARHITTVRFLDIGHVEFLVALHGLEPSFSCTILHSDWYDLRALFELIGEQDKQPAITKLSGAEWCGTEHGFGFELRIPNESIDMAWRYAELIKMRHRSQGLVQPIIQ